MAARSATQRTLLLSFIASIAVCGLVAIFCLLTGSLSDVAVRVLTVSAAPNFGCGRGPR